MTRPALLALLLLAAAAGCASLDRPAPDRGYFLIDPGVPARQTGALVAPDPGRPTLKVGAWRVSPRFARQDIVYRLGANQYAADYYNFHFAPPGQTLAESARSWLDSSGLFSAVVDGGSQALTSYELDGLVTDLYGDLRDESAPKATIAVRLFVVDRRTAVWRVVRTLDLRADVPMRERSVAALVQAWGEGFRTVLIEAETILAAEVAPEPMQAGMVQ